MLRHRNAVVFQRGKRTCRHAVVIGKHGRQLKITPQQFHHCRFTALHVRRTGTYPAFQRRNALLFQGVLPALAAHHVVFNTVAGGQITNALMAVADEHPRRHHRAADVIQTDAAVRVAGDDTIDQRHAGDLLHKPGQLFIAQGFRVHNQGVTALADQYLNGITLFFSLVIAVANQHIFLVLLGNDVHRFDQRAEEGVRHVHHHYANGIADLRRQRLGISVWPVPQLGHGFHYGFTRFRADQRTVVQHAGDSSNRNTRLAGDVTNGDHDRYLDVLRNDTPEARAVNRRHAHSSGPWRKKRSQTTENTTLTIQTGITNASSVRRSNFINRPNR